MISTIVFAAAGRGTRMQHLSEDKPKHLVSVAGKPFFAHVLRSAAQAGFTKMVVVVGYKADAMREFLAQQPYDVTIVEQPAVVGDKYGTASVVEAARGTIGDEPFVSQNGDSLYSPEVYAAVREDDGFHHVVGTYHEDPSHYGVIERTDGEFLVEIVEKPAEPKSNVINLGLYAFQPSIHEAVTAVTPSARGEYEIIDAVNALAAEHQVKVHQMEGEWVDLGKPEDIPHVERFIHKYYDL